MNNFEKTYFNIIFEEAKTKLFKKSVSVKCDIKTKEDDPITKDIENAKIKEIESSNSTLGSLLQTIGKRMLGVGRAIEKREEKNSNKDDQTTEIKVSSTDSGGDGSSGEPNTKLPEPTESSNKKDKTI